MNFRLLNKTLTSIYLVYSPTSVKTLT